ncbi:hypothetical protein EUX98_g5418 [Antrodiella citrinella]|uniref:Uncharacterized protein n=1 Tax=Antrodiella citrinella TaxID=2447956 RepID=A0A4S4MTV3_9APHY|nr:hypothetical protein EUX98_g5418 [Antrodiella citrinella]
MSQPLPDQARVRSKSPGLFKQTMHAFQGCVSARAFSATHHSGPSESSFVIVDPPEPKAGPGPGTDASFTAEPSVDQASLRGILSTHGRSSPSLEYESIHETTVSPGTPSLVPPPSPSSRAPSPPSQSTDNISRVHSEIAEEPRETAVARTVPRKSSHPSLHQVLDEKVILKYDTRKRDSPSHGRRKQASKLSPLRKVWSKVSFQNRKEKKSKPVKRVIVEEKDPWIEVKELKFETGGPSNWGLLEPKLTVEFSGSSDHQSSFSRWLCFPWTSAYARRKRESVLQEIKSVQDDVERLESSFSFPEDLTIVYEDTGEPTKCSMKIPRGAGTRALIQYIDDLDALWVRLKKVSLRGADLEVKSTHTEAMNSLGAATHRYREKMDVHILLAKARHIDNRLACLEGIKQVIEDHFAIRYNLTEVVKSLNGLPPTAEPPYALERRLREIKDSLQTLFDDLTQLTSPDLAITKTHASTLEHLVSTSNEYEETWEAYRTRMAAFVPLDPMIARVEGFATQLDDIATVIKEQEDAHLDSTMSKKATSGLEGLGDDPWDFALVDANLRTRFNTSSAHISNLEHIRDQLQALDTELEDDEYLLDAKVRCSELQATARTLFSKRFMLELDALAEYIEAVSEVGHFAQCLEHLDLLFTAYWHTVRPSDSGFDLKNPNNTHERQICESMLQKFHTLTNLVECGDNVEAVTSGKTLLATIRHASTWLDKQDKRRAQNGTQWLPPTWTVTMDSEAADEPETTTC